MKFLLETTWVKFKILTTSELSRWDFNLIKGEHFNFSTKLHSYKEYIFDIHPRKVKYIKLKVAENMVTHSFHARGNKFKPRIKSCSLKAGISYLNSLDLGGLRFTLPLSVF